MAKKIKVEEIVEKVSKLYREERNKEYALSKELETVSSSLKYHEEDGWKDITVAEYENLKRLNHTLEQSKKLQEKYCEGISVVRELLMDLGFDIVVDMSE